MSAAQIWERLWVGSIFDAEALADSNPQRITTVITLSPEAAPEELPGINQVYLPLLGDHAIPVEMFDEIIDAVWENIRWGSVFVHSLAEVRRTLADMDEIEGQLKKAGTAIEKAQALTAKYRARLTGLCGSAAAGRIIPGINERRYGGESAGNGNGTLKHQQSKHQEELT